MRVADPRAREWYLREAASQQWSVRELERNINSFYYQRHLESSENATQRATDSNAMNPRQLMKWHRRHYLRG